MKFMPAAFVSALTVFAGCCSTPPSSMVVTDPTPPLDVPKLANDLAQVTVALIAEDEGVTNVYCAGVWVANDRILTADHCARAQMERIFGMDADDAVQRALLRALLPGAKVAFITRDDSAELWEAPVRVRMATVSRTDYEHDLAMLVVDPADVPETHPVAKVATFSAIQGQDVHVMGHPGGMSWSYAKGYVSAERNTFKAVKELQGPWFQIDCAAWKGNSGGGVYNDAGELIGLGSFLTLAPGHVIFTHQSTLSWFLAGEGSQGI